MCLSWGPVGGQVLVHNPVDLCIGCGPCFRCFKEISWNVLCNPSNSALQLRVLWYGLMDLGIHIHTVSVLNPQKVVSICTVHASSSGMDLLGSAACPGRKTRPFPCLGLGVLLHFISIFISLRIDTVSWAFQSSPKLEYAITKRDLLLWRFCSNQDGSVLDEHLPTLRVLLMA